jgi:hypothetical protein
MKVTQESKYEYMAVHLPRPTKKRLRLIAAEMEMPLGKAAECLLEMGIAALDRKNQGGAEAEARE